MAHQRLRPPAISIFWPIGMSLSSAMTLTGCFLLRVLSYKGKWLARVRHKPNADCLRCCEVLLEVRIRGAGPDKFVGENIGKEIDLQRQH